MKNAVEHILWLRFCEFILGLNMFGVSAKFSNFTFQSL